MNNSNSNRLNKIIPQVGEWARDLWPPAGWLDEYVAGGSLVVLGAADLFKFGMEKIGKSLHSARDGKWFVANHEMCTGFLRMAIGEMVCICCLKGTGRTITNNLDGLTHLMLGTLALGQPHLIQMFHKVVFDGLAGNYGVRDGHELPVGSTLRYAAFGLSIIGDWLGQPLDLDKHKLPRDPAWGLLVANWREPDVEKFLPILMSACDTHIERIGVTSRDFDQPEKYEFGSALLAVHPAEILAVLRLRELVGLSNPDDIPHPLMQTPYARITCRPGELNLQDELLERFLATVRLRDPHVLPPDL